MFMTGEVKWADVPDPYAESFGGNESRCQLSDGPKPAAGNQTCESRSSLFTARTCIIILLMCSESNVVIIVEHTQIF